MLGYLAAVRIGATIIAETDDDKSRNKAVLSRVPRGRSEHLARPRLREHLPVLHAATHLAARSAPTQSPGLGQPDRSVRHTARQRNRRRLAGPRDGDPDVDAIYRLTVGQECIFEQRPPLVLGRGTISPFNSQNTAFSAELFPLLYLPSTVTFRFTDILRGYVAQPVMWSAGYQLGFVGVSII